MQRKCIVIPGKLAIASATRNPGVLALWLAGFHRHDDEPRIYSTNSISGALLFAVFFARLRVPGTVGEER
jgi:hypothetical protein